MSENNANGTNEIVLSIEMSDAISAQTAEAWAVGKRGGVDVADTDPTYHNNAKYYAEQCAGAEQAAQDAEEAAAQAESAKTDAEAARDRAEAIGAGAAQSAGAAAESAQAAATAKAGAESAQTAAAGSANSAAAAATSAASSASTATGAAAAASSSETAAGQSASAAAGSATAADESAQAAAQSAEDAQEVLDSIPADYSQLSDDVSSLKSAFEQLNDNVITDSAGPSPIVSIADGADGMPMRKVEVAIEPVQDLHGYDSPWPAGGGKNLLDPSNLEVASTATYVWGYRGTGYLFKSGVAYTISVTDNITIASFRIVSVDEETVLAQAASGTSNRIVYYTPESDTYGVIRMYNGSSFDLDAVKAAAMIEVGSARTAWSPYSNICPISGWTGAKVTRTGVNIWDEEWELGGLSVTNGTEQERTDRIRMKNFVPVLPNTTYYKHGPNPFWNIYFDKDKNYISYGNSNVNGTFTTPNNCYYLRCAFESNYGTTYNHNVSINYPATDTEYHPGDVQTVEVTFPDTFYGGTLDVTEGKLTIDRAIVDLGTLTWAHTAYGYVSQNFGNIAKTYPNNVPNKVVFEKYKSKPSRTGGYYPGEPSTISLNENGNLYTSAPESPTGQCSYELKTPVLVDLDPVTLETLLGVNNIWADAGQVAVEYLADTKLYIDKKIAELQALILENNG